MGKTKKGKPKPHKVNPIHNLLTPEDGMDENEPSGGPIQSILDQLQSPSSDFKMCGLQALSTLCQKEINIAAIVSSEIVRTAAPLLVDQDANIRHAAAGALRNLSAVSVEICENLVEQDVFTPLLILLNQYVNNDWRPTTEKKAEQLDQKSDTFLQAVNIVWNLCESTSVALEYFNQSQLLESFVRCLNYEVFGLDISTSVAQCLLVISEDNTAAWKTLAKFEAEFQSLLIIDGDFQKVILRTVVAGIMSNVPVLSMQNLARIIEALSRTLNVNHRTILNDITSKIPLEDNNVQPIEVIDEEMQVESDADASLRRLKDDQPSGIDAEVKLVEYLLSAQRISAEILSNICTPDDDEMYEDVEDNSDVESVHDYDMAQQQNGNQPTADKIPVEVSEAVKSHQIVEKLWARTQVLPENVLQILKENSKTLFKRQTSLRISSLLCLQNFCNCMTTEELGGATSIYNVWLDLGQQIFQIQQDFETIEASTCLMRATLDHLKKSPQLFNQVTESDLQLILDGVNSCQHTEIRANWMRMLGTLGGILPNEAMVSKVTEFILTTTVKENDVWTISESLDSFMDMFSVNDWNQVVHDLSVIPKSRELEKILKTKMRQQKRELGDRYPSILTVRTNFARFCKYLESQQKGFTPTQK